MKHSCVKNLWKFYKILMYLETFNNGLHKMEKPKVSKKTKHQNETVKESMVKFYTIKIISLRKLASFTQEIYMKCKDSFLASNF